jgi:5'-deoxynucleotidase YfbR-like HD superfamily hydrolase
VSVAQHSVYVSWLCDGPSALQALLHDATEAYLGDVTKYVKASPEMAGYRAAEDAAWRAVCERFSIPETLAPGVEAADKLMVRYEAMMAWRPEGLPVPGYGPLTDAELAAMPRWEFWSWDVAEELFLARYYNLRTVWEV